MANLFCIVSFFSISLFINFFTNSHKNITVIQHEAIKLIDQDQKEIQGFDEQKQGKINPQVQNHILSIIYNKMNKVNLYGKRKYSQVNPSSMFIHYLEMTQNQNFNNNSLFLKSFITTTQKKHVGNEIEIQNQLESIKEQKCCWVQKTNLCQELEKQNIYEFHTIEEIQSVENLYTDNLNQTVHMFNTIKQHPIKL